MMILNGGGPQSELQKASSMPMNFGQFLAQNPGVFPGVHTFPELERLERQWQNFYTPAGADMARNAVEGTKNAWQYGPGGIEREKIATTRELARGSFEEKMGDAMSKFISANPKATPQQITDFRKQQEEMLSYLKEQRQQPGVQKRPNVGIEPPSNKTGSASQPATGQAGSDSKEQLQAVLGKDAGEHLANGLDPSVNADPEEAMAKTEAAYPGAVSKNFDAIMRHLIDRAGGNPDRLRKRVVTSGPLAWSGKALDLITGKPSSPRNQPTLMEGVRSIGNAMTGSAPSLSDEFRQRMREYFARVQ